MSAHTHIRAHTHTRTHTHTNTYTHMDAMERDSQTTGLWRPPCNLGPLGPTLPLPCVQVLPDGRGQPQPAPCGGDNTAEPGEAAEQSEGPRSPRGPAGVCVCACVCVCARVRAYACFCIHPCACMCVFSLMYEYQARLSRLECTCPLVALGVLVGCLVALGAPLLLLVSAALVF